MASSFSELAQFSKVVAAFADDLGGKVVKDITHEMGVKAEEIARSAAVRTLGGDIKHTGKGRGWGIPLDTKLSTKADGVTILSPTRISAGPWTEVERGRNQGDTGQFLGPGVIRTGKDAGTTARNKSGAVRKVRKFKARRWNGRTRAKGTASAAVDEMVRVLPPLAEKLVNEAIVRRFGKG